MKKAVLTVLFMTAALGVYAQNGVIKEMIGTVELKAAGAAGYTMAKAGDTVAQDTIISTGLKSTAAVEVGSAVIAVLPLTRLTLTEILSSRGSETLNLSLQTGRVRVDVNPPAGTKASLTVSSPSATASVRGTSFYFDTRSVSVSHGSVFFKGNRGYAVQVGGGAVAIVEPKGNAAPPQVAGYRPSMPVGYDPSGGSIGRNVPRELPPGTGDIGIDYTLP